MRLVLASASPRRAELLRAAGFDFEVDPADVDERVVAGESPREHVLRLARAKAAAAAARHPDAAVVGADTVVAVDGAILGKPSDPADARRMLRLLSGRSHDVHTGVAVIYRGVLAEAAEVSAVRFTPLTEEEIDWYVASGEPDDKAGAYAIQGLAARFVDRIEGSYGTVVGLPIHLVHRLLKEVRKAGLDGATPAGRDRSPGGSRH